jgi:hypothetical protein
MEFEKLIYYTLSKPGLDELHLLVDLLLCGFHGDKAVNHGLPSHLDKALQPLYLIIDVGRLIRQIGHSISDGALIIYLAFDVGKQLHRDTIGGILKQGLDLVQITHKGIIQCRAVTLADAVAVTAGGDPHIVHFVETRCETGNLSGH